MIRQGSEQKKTREFAGEARARLGKTSEVGEETAV